MLLQSGMSDLRVCQDILLEAAPEVGSQDDEILHEIDFLETLSPRFV